MLAAGPRFGDPLFKWITGLFAVLVAGLAALIMVEMAINSWLPLQKFGFGFLTRKLDGAWRGHSDTETLVEALAAWGLEAALPRLNGIFAFAALDMLAGKLYLARDPFGVKRR